MLNDKRGSVSVFLMILIVPVFLFHAVFIDFARVKLAQRESEGAVKTAARSMLSYFDPEMQKYGLFGFDMPAADSEEIFAMVLKKNLAVSGGFQYIDVRPEAKTPSITPVYSLANHTVFKRQVLEEMKYKSPIQFSLEIADKFKKTGLDQSMQRASVFSANAVELQKLLDKRDELLSAAWNQTEQMVDKANKYYGYYNLRLNELSSLADQIGIQTADDMKSNIQQARKEMTSLAESLKSIDGSLVSLVMAGAEAVESIRALSESRSRLVDHISELEAKINDWERLLHLIIQYGALVAVTRQEVSLNEAALVSYQKTITDTLAEAQKVNNELNEKLKGVTANSGPDGQNLAADDVFQHIRMLHDSYFQEYGVGVSSILALFSGFKASVQSTLLYTGDALQKVRAGNESFHSHTVRFYDKRSDQENNGQSGRRTDAQKQREQKNKLNDVLDTARNAIGSCSIVEAANGGGEPYTRLKNELVPKYRSESGVPAGVDIIEIEDADRTAKRSMALLSQIAGLMNSVRDQYYVDEFVLSKYGYRTFGMEKGSDGALKQLPAEPAQPGTHVLQKQEAEFILYGLNSCAANYSAAYGEMFALRLAVRTMEALAGPGTEFLQAGSPLLVLLAAAAEGSVKALNDMNRLIDGEDVPVSRKLPDTVRMGYKDYLRLFYMLHGSERTTIPRMQALIDLNTGKDLQKETTYIQAAATTSLRLWFLPEAMKTLGKAGVLNCRVTADRCQITKTAVMSY